jgi:site-specific recombinase XerD
MGFQYLPRRARRISVAGPLAPFADDLRRDLAGRGYALDTVTEYVHRLADLSGWLADRDLTAADLTSEAAGQFLQERRAAGCGTGVSPRAFAPVLGYLREAGAAPLPGPPVLMTALDALLAEYQRYLEAERGVSAGTVRHYLRYGRAFLNGLAGPLDQALAGLSAGQVTKYVLERARRRPGTAPQDMTILPALRSLLRFLHVTGHTGLPLAGAVPAGRSWKPGLPRAAPADDLRAVLAACDRQSAGGRRDYAIVLAMTRLALRGGEVARLRLADIGWRSGELTIAGKGGRKDILPLPADVGAAMADYLLQARPATTCPALFVGMKAPFGALAVSSVTGLVGRACERAGVPRFGPHRIRHAAACGLLAAGAPMEEISQLLRHARQRTTAIYAKVDQARLAELAMPCPTGAPR